MEAPLLYPPSQKLFKKSSKPQLVWLQVFRGLAAALVVIHHVAGNTKFYFHESVFGGVFDVSWFGVDFFFVLSGFIITYIHFNDIGNRASLKKYFEKRFFRIYPIYWVAAVITIFSFLNNDWLYLFKSTFLIPQDKAPYVRIAWSLVYEVGFYLLFGLYIFLGKRWALVVFILHICLIISTQLFDLTFTNDYLTLYSNGFNIEFIFGCLTALFFLRIKQIKYVNLLFISSLCVFILLWHLSLVNPLFSKFSFISRLTYGLTFAGLTYAGSVVAYNPSGVFFTFLKKLGDASYSIYLFHVIIISALCRLSIKANFHVNLTLLGMIAFCACIVLGLFIHVYIEKPLNKVINEKFKK